MNKFLFSCLFFFLSICNYCQDSSAYTLIKPARVFDGEQMHSDWVVLIKENIIEAAGPMKFKLPAGTKIIELPGQTLMPGMIEGHSHLFLHPYNETSWDDQVLKESRAERTARAVNHAAATLMAGFTTVRDLGTEGAQYDDVGLKTAIEKKLIPGPRMIVATRAIVLKGSYGPKSGNPEVVLPQGAAEVSDIAEMTREVNEQVGKGADLIKIYADYRYGKDEAVHPTFETEIMTRAVNIAKNAGLPVVMHAASAEGIKRAVMAGASTIEHGDQATAEVLELMKNKSVALCPTLAAGESVARYKGWRKGTDPEPERIKQKKISFQLALKTGVTICMGGDVGVFTHGDNALEMELMVEYGMKTIDVLRSATSVNADVFGYGDRIGRIKKGLLADLVSIDGDPSADIHALRKVRLVIKDGTIYNNK